eukprot:m.402492 g.402492  ORF g.402492 m.402492 type:complete len:551 (+) comp20119_c2_seq2:2787-4439(+)
MCTRTNIPLACAFALTIHKVQGQTLERVLVYAGLKEFTPGLLYVALSRVRRPTRLLVADLTRARFEMVKSASAQWSLYTELLRLLRAARHTFERLGCSRELLTEMQDEVNSWEQSIAELSRSIDAAERAKQRKRDQRNNNGQSNNSIDNSEVDQVNDVGEVGGHDEFVGRKRGMNRGQKRTALAEGDGHVGAGSAHGVGPAGRKRENSRGQKRPAPPVDNGREVVALVACSDGVGPAIGGGVRGLHGASWPWENMSCSVDGFATVWFAASAFLGGFDGDEAPMAPRPVRDAWAMEQCRTRGTYVAALFVAQRTVRGALALGDVLALVDARERLVGARAKYIRKEYDEFVREALSASPAATPSPEMPRGKRQRLRSPRPPTPTQAPTLSLCEFNRALGQAKVDFNVVASARDLDGNPVFEPAVQFAFRSTRTCQGECFDGPWVRRNEASGGELRWFRVTRSCSVCKCQHGDWQLTHAPPMSWSRGIAVLARFLAPAIAGVQPIYQLWGKVLHREHHFVSVCALACLDGHFAVVFLRQLCVCRPACHSPLRT